MEVISQNDLLQYYYKECTPAKALAIKIALITDEALSERMQQLEETIKELDKIVGTKPSSKTMLQLLQTIQKTPPPRH